MKGLFSVIGSRLSHGDARCTHLGGRGGGVATATSSLLLSPCLLVVAPSACCGRLVNDAWIAVSVRCAFNGAQAHPQIHDLRRHLRQKAVPRNLQGAADGLMQIIQEVGRASGKTAIPLSLPSAHPAASRSVQPAGRPARESSRPEGRQAV